MERVRSPYYACSLTGKVCSKQGGLCVGRLKICLNERVPNDISDGKYVSVNVQRLDV